MSHHHTYKKLEIVGTSPNSIEEAIQNAITETANSVNHLDWFEVIETRGHIIKNQIAHYQVTLKIGFRIDNS
ncbi:MAG: dodecin flavoprotein [Gammaproteobacteria bacterium]|nr:MAG: dodecin flavoprotein [Gammaproteobacteria bacterium]PHR84423.1 MAG: dodecin flavoprotein [Colwellia sp.]